LVALARKVGIQPQNNWGSYLREIENELTDNLRKSGKLTAEEHFYAEAAAHIDHVKRAWRNPTMHVDRTYTSERAEEILKAVQSLMSHLTTKVSECLSVY